MRRIVADIETNGLLDEVSTVHCLVLRDLDSDRVVSCTDSAPAEWYDNAKEWDSLYYRANLSYGYRLLRQAERIYFHNGIGYDYPALTAVNGATPFEQEKLGDTLVMARVLFAHVGDLDGGLIAKGTLPPKYRGLHSLAAWGYRLRVLKGAYGKEETQSWETWTPEMQEYCEQDTLVGKKLVGYLQSELRLRVEGNHKVYIDAERELAEYLTQQERNGFPFNHDSAVELHINMASRREALGVQLRQVFGFLTIRDGKVRTVKRTVTKKEGKKCLMVEGTEYQKVKYVQYSPTSRDHTGIVLQRRYGWKPTAFGKDGKPTVDEDTLMGFNFPERDLLIEYLTIQKVIGMLAESKRNNAWLQIARNHGATGGRLTGKYHIHGGCSDVAVTHRHRHSRPNLGQVPSVHAKKDGTVLWGYPGRFGADCRALFGAGVVGWWQVGADMSGLELRNLAHYMARYDNGEYAKVILLGDIHATNRDALALEGKPGRDVAKRFIYAFLYGAGDVLIGMLIFFALRDNKLPCPIVRKRSDDDEKFFARVGAYYRSKFLKGLPALGYLMEVVSSKARHDKYILLPDGRRSYIRHQHAALNTLLQGAGAILSKWWIVEYARRLRDEFGPQGWLGEWAALAWVHDENQLAVRLEENTHRVGQIMVQSIECLTDRFGWRIPLTGEYKIGRNWLETH
jgi:DNA polymerase I